MRLQESMGDHSKLIGYLTLITLVIVFVGWAKFSFVSESFFWAVAAAAGAFFVGWRAIVGVWPGNDAPR
jgi:hypothetical protein